MALTDPGNIPPEIQDQIEAAAHDLGKGLVWAALPAFAGEPDNDDPKVLLLAQACQRALTALAMMVL